MLFKKVIAFCIALFFLSGCAMIRTQQVVPPDLIYQSQIPNMKNVRIVVNPSDSQKTVDYFAPAYKDLHTKLVSGKNTNTLIVSGGGANGAYGAGVLYGWSKTGTRPAFDLVTGVSTGAFIGMFAFLGPEYDEQLKTVYTTISDKHIFLIRKWVSLILLRNDSIASTKPFKEMLARYVNMDVLQKVAAEHAKGRYFYVLTAQLDAKRLVIWDMGEIAQAGTPQALELFRNVLLASAALPVIFSPVHFTVTADGKTYDELHVDGGVGAQLFGGYYPKEALVGAKGQANLYVIRNAKLVGDPKKVTPGIISIANDALDMIITSQAVGDIFRVYSVSHDERVNFNLAFIPYDFSAPKNGEFDPIYMQKLFTLAANQAANHTLWKDNPHVYENFGWEKK